MAARKSWIKTVEGNLLNVRQISQVKYFRGDDKIIPKRVAVQIKDNWYTLKEFESEEEARKWMVSTFPTK